MRTYYIAKLFCLYKNQEWLVFFQALEKEANYDGECSFYIWQSVLTVFCRFLRLLCRHWLNITNFLSLRKAIFYLTRDKSVISQANKSSGRLSEHRTSFILPAGTPSCIIYMIGQAWKKHRAVQYSLCNWPLINSCSFPMTFLILSLLDKSRNALQARARIQSASTNGVFTISKESRTLMPLLTLTFESRLGFRLKFCNSFTNMQTMKTRVIIVVTPNTT